MELNFLNTLREYAQDDKKMPEEIKKEIEELENCIFDLQKRIHCLVDNYITSDYEKNNEVYLPVSPKCIQKEHILFYSHIDSLTDKWRKNFSSNECKEIDRFLILKGCDYYNSYKPNNYEPNRKVKNYLAQEIMYKHITHYINIFNSLKLFCIKRYGHNSKMILAPRRMQVLFDERARITADDEHKEYREEIENELNKRYAFDENYEQIDDFSNKLRIKTYKEIREREYPRKLFLRRVFMFIFFSVGWVSVTVAAALFTKNFCNMIMEKDTTIRG